MIFELLTTISFLAGLQFLLTVILPIVAILASTLFLIDRAQLIVYRAAVNSLELLTRWYAIQDDRNRRELALAEAGISLRARRLELQGKRLELLDSLDSETKL